MLQATNGLNNAGKWLILLLALLRVLVEHVAKVVPSTLGNENRVAEITLDLADGDVAALGIFLAGEEEVLVLDANVPRVRSLGSGVSLAVIVLLDQLFQVVVELLHAVRGDENLKARVAARKSLRYLEEPSSGVLLQQKTRVI